MGEFTMTCLRRGLRRRVVQDNILHDEGADYLLRRMFPVGGAFTGARSDWQLCIGGIRCTQPAATPNGNLGIFFDYDRGRRTRKSPRSRRTRAALTARIMRRFWAMPASR
jgi:hypothetical protein